MVRVLLYCLCTLLFSGCSQQPQKSLKKDISSDVVVAKNVSSDESIYSPINYKLAERDESEKNLIKTVRCKLEAGSRRADSFTQELEAKLIDIPIPLSAKPLLDYYTAGSDLPIDLLGYNVSMELEDVLKFYEHEMERLGWQRLAFCTGFETLLTFSKPDRLCSISIRPQSTKFGKSRNVHDVIISLGKKEARY